MKKTLLSLLLVLSTASAFAWGEWGHQHINRSAIFALPPEMRIFFYDHADYLTLESIAPDLRKYTIRNEEEFARHYIDLEAYNYTTTSALPQSLTQARSIYSDSFLRRNGILPWHLQIMMEKLTQAFKDSRESDILFLAGDMGHYIADACMPLHTTLNHDGQLTGQQGIHSFWESQVPEMFGAGYDLYTGDAHYIKNTNKEIWKIIAHSFSLANSVLLADKLLRRQFPADSIFLKDAGGKIVRNRFNAPVHTRRYARAYNRMLNGMVEHQLRLAIAETANFWYTAWVNAGKPDLSFLDSEIVRKRNARYLRNDYKNWEKGNVKDLQPFREFDQ
ncbi:MAG: S1/P1 Nuclease [Taibaiella sp.]|nr:S1/P1 Nuclease [Taibaiella sp.]